MNDPRFKQMVNLLAAHRAYRGGQSVKSIAKQAKVTPRTVRRWLAIWKIARARYHDTTLPRQF